MARSQLAKLVLAAATLLGLLALWTATPARAADTAAPDGDVVLVQTANV